MRGALRRRSALLLALAGPLSLQAQEAAFPSRPIKIVITFAPGSGSDVIARFIGTAIGKTLGQTVIVESRVGGQGTVGAEYVRRAAPDGYTMLLGGNSTHAANVFLVKNLPYDPLRDFTPVSQVTLNPLVLVVRSELPVHNVREFITWVKANPSKVNYGVGNSGGRAAVQLLQSLTGISAQDVPYPGTGQAALDMVGGRLDFMITDPGVAGPFIAQGKLRALAVSSSVRLPSMPNVPTLIEAGVPGYDYASWVGLYLPAKTPQPIVDKINAAVVQALKTPEARDFYGGLGIIPQPSSPDELARFTKDQIELWGRLVKQAGMQPL
jgi:tripartite-type tricarboxylate transporter receptor subunit TctC